jgi:hypothetical protein
MNKKVSFIVRLAIISAILWTLIWSGVKIWQNYTFEKGWSGFPYKYSVEISCDERGCEREWNYFNLIIDAAAVLAVSFLITLITYTAKKKLV